MKVHNKVFFTVALGHVLISDAHLHVSDFYSLFNLSKIKKDVFSSSILTCFAI